MMAFWTPADISTALWLDASDSSTLFDATTGGSTPADDGQIARWEDKSGNARHATQSSSSSRGLRKTTIQNGLDIVRLNGLNDFFGLPTFTATAGISCFAVFITRRTGSGRDGGIVLASSSTANEHFGGGDESGGRDWFSSFFSTSRPQITATAYPTGFAYLTEIQQTGSALSGRVDAVSVGSPSATFNGSPSTMSVGRAPGGFSSQKDYCEICFVQSPSTSTRQQIEGYLAHKWGLAGSLPSDHPYKSAAPTQSIYAVNGKAPIAAWIPSLDTAGNGTTTLTDLVGSNNGTLTNMDEATDWVADTGAGGVRALDFDGVDDFVNLGLLNLTSSGIAISVWAFSRTLPSISRWVSLSNESFVIRSESNRARVFYFNTSNTLVSLFSATSTAFVNQWTHWVGVHTGSRLKIYKNGVEIADMAAASARRTTTTTNAALSQPEETFDGLIDDIRIFNQALAADDISYLYNSGNGRGRTATGTVQTRRRRDLGGYGL